MTKRIAVKRLLLATLLTAAGCATTTRYITPVRQEPTLGPLGLNITVFSLEYSTSRFLNPGWFVARPITIVIENDTDDSVLVDWDRSALVSPNGETMAIIHSGVLFADAKQGNYRTYQRQSVIAPHAKLTDIIVPTSWIQEINYEWQLCIQPVPEARFVLSTTLEVGGKLTTMTTPFRFGAGQIWPGEQAR